MSVSLARQHINHMQSFQTRVSDFQEQFDTWADAKLDEVQQTVEAHTMYMEDGQQSLRAMEKQHSQLESLAQQVQNQLQQENEEIDACQQQIEQAQADKKTATEECTAMKMKVHEEKKGVEKKTKEVEQAKSELDTRVKDAQEGLFFYEDRLKLSFEVLQQDYLRFVFTHVDPKDAERQFLFTVHVDIDDQYYVDECSPGIGGRKLSSMAKELNKSNNFSHFVVAMRREFREIALSE